MTIADAELLRLEEDRLGKRPWKRWGPYVSERSWGTVREDYSADGSAWSYFPHDHARSRAYRWGEDGLAGICDRYQILVFALALWNGRDPILKERLFGLTPAEANHGEDVKEYYFYLDSTPTHSYMKWLYKYPQAEYPYSRLIEENRRRSTREREFELLDTGVFDQDRYFDVFVEYAKADAEDLCIRIEAHNRGPEPAPLHVLPMLWFRNSWSWGRQPLPEPIIRQGPAQPGCLCLEADEAGMPPPPNLPFEYRLGKRYLYGSAGGRPLFTNNETHAERVWGPHARSRSRYVKDAFHRHIITGEDCVNPDAVGTRAGLQYGDLVVPAGGSVVLRLRLTDRPLADPLAGVDAVVAQRLAEADAFYERLHPPRATEDERRVQRQTLAGLLWTKQSYLFDVTLWLDGDNPEQPPPASRKTHRNVHWRHLNSMRILSMPDKWEYPWFAAWDLAFHTLPLALVNPEFAKEQLWVLLFEQFQHVNGQLPAYEWEFSDLNPPVHAWAVWRVYNLDRRTGRTDRAWLERCFHKLLINFAWWVNKVDADGHNVFEGGFLGLDNITILDRSEKLGPGTVLKQSDATGWMGMFCLNLMRISLELARDNPAYTGLATKFFQHFAHIGVAINRKGQGNYFELWSETDGIFYDVLCYPDGSYHKIRLRSLVGLVPLYAADLLEDDELAALPEFRSNVEWFLKNRRAMADVCIARPERDGRPVYLLSLLTEKQLRRLLGFVWGPGEFRGSHGLRSLSKWHEAHPFVLGDFHVPYEPGEAVAVLKGGNSNWRGPVWFPTNFLMIEALRRQSAGRGPSFVLEAAADEPPVSLEEMAHGLADRLISLFTCGTTGRRPIHGGREKFQTDPYWRDCLLFHEYFHGDTGEGLGAIHQTGWTGLVATLIDEWRR